jgi:hypothetical protein
MIADHIDTAYKTLAVKTKEQIDEETAYVWGARAVVAFTRFNETHKSQWLVDAIEYAHEMCEHAAGGPPGTLERVRAELKELTGGRL